MEDKDLKDVCAIERISFPNPWHLNTFRGEIQNDLISFPYVVVHSLLKKVIAYVIYWQIEDEIQINNIAVHPDFRRMGIGEAVLRKILEKVRKGGARSVFLEVRPSNEAAQALYAKLGFKLIGIRKNYYFNPQEDALVLGLDLIQ